MSKDLVKYTLPDETEVLSGITSSFNTRLNYEGVAINNRINVVNKVYISTESSKYDSPVIEKIQTIIYKIKSIWRSIRGLNDQKEVDHTAFTEFYRNDKEIMELIWKHLSFQDKLDCTLVCQRFNRIISEMDYFYLTKSFTSKLQIIPSLSRNYSTVKFQHYQCDNLKPRMNKMFNHFHKSLKNLTLDNCQFEMMTLIEILNKLPLLESLQLNLTLKAENNVELSTGEEPQLIQLKVLKIQVIEDKLEEILVLLSSAINLESISLFDAKFDIDVINYLKQYKSLTSLSLSKCIIKTTSYISTLNSLHFDSSVKLPKVDSRIFNNLKNLRTLELIQVDNELLNILVTECACRLADFKIVYNIEQAVDVHYVFQVFIFINNHFVDKNSIEDCDKLINVGYTWTFLKGKNPKIDILFYDAIEEVQKRIEINLNKNENNENPNDYELMLSYKIRPIATMNENEIEDMKFEYSKILSPCPILQNSVFQESMRNNSISLRNVLKNFSIYERRDEELLSKMLQLYHKVGFKEYLK